MNNKHTHKTNDESTQKRLICKSDDGMTTALYNDEPGVFYVLDNWNGNPGSFLLQDGRFSIADTEEFAAHIVAGVDAAAIG